MQAYEYIEKGIKVELYSIGEGWNGDYDEDDAEDEELIRFSVYLDKKRKSDQSEHVTGIWYAEQDSSWCTGIPTNITQSETQKLAEIIWAEANSSPHKDMAILSHIKRSELS